MNRASSLSFIAIGAIFAFAVTASPGFLNLQVVGLILMSTGAAGLLLEGRSRDWLRRTVIVRGRPPAAGPTGTPAHGPIDPPAHGPTAPPARRHAEPPAQRHAEPPAQGPTEPPAQGPTEPPAQGPTEPPAQGPSESPLADRPTQPLGAPVERQPIERETIEEYIEQ